MWIARRAAAVVVAAALAAPVSTAAAVSPLPPHVTVLPDNVMVNTVVTLTGTGFAPLSTLRVQECGATSWIAPQNPCDTTNAITVATGASGTFTAKFKVELCPRAVPPTATTPITEETCYIGVPHPTGVDTIGLLGAAPVIVTYP